MIETRRRRRRSAISPSSTTWRVTALELSLVGLLVLTIIAPALEMPKFSFANPSRQVGYIALALLVFIALDPRQIRRLLVVPWPIVLTLGWCWLSLTWSSNIGLSFSRLLLTSIVIWIAFAAVPAIGSARTLLIMRIILTTALIANYAVVYLFPDVGMHLDHEGLWRGFMSSKNHAGAICALTIITWLFKVPQRQRLIGTLVAISSAIFLWFSGSRTPMIMLIIAVSMSGLVQTFIPLIKTSLTRERRDNLERSGFALFGVLTLFMIYITFFSSALINLTENSNIFSGRNQLWQPLLVFYLDHPLSGSGFGGFWMDAQRKMQNSSGVWLDNVSQGHNGYLEMAIQTGLPGLLLALFAGIVWPIRNILRQITLCSDYVPVVLGIFIFCIGSNITESGFFLRDTLWQVFLMLALAMLCDGHAKELDLQASRRRQARRRREAEAVESLKSSIS
jgi:exopolysaccharide production protein ExoQ